MSFVAKCYDACVHVKLGDINKPVQPNLYGEVLCQLMSYVPKRRRGLNKKKKKEMLNINKGKSETIREINRNGKKQKQIGSEMHDTE